MDFDSVHLIDAFGYLGLAAAVFAESGFFLGLILPLPGDTLLLTAGLLAARGKLDLAWLLLLLPLAAIAGDSVGYWFGQATGPRLFSRECSILFRKKDLTAARAFYDRHGGKTIVIARFVPFIRTLAPIIAGAAGMNYRRFLLFNVVGGVLWAVGLTTAGYTLGQSIPDLDRYFLVAMLAVCGLSALFGVIHLARQLGPRLRPLLAGQWRPGQCPPDPDALPD